MALLTAGAISPTVAFAGGDWPRPVAGAVVLPYGANYAGATGSTCTHGGLDLAAEAGETVHSCTDGDVTFAGRVPAGEGAQAYAVTVATSDGLHVTYLPLRSAAVAKGARVAAGAILGRVAEGGDASSSAIHLHLGVRRGEARLDPAGFLANVASTSSEGAVPKPSAVPVPSSAPVDAPAPAVPGSPVAAHSPAPAGVRADAAGAPSALSVAPQVTASALGEPLTPAEAFSEGARTAAAAIAHVPELRRIREIEAGRTLNLARIGADLRAGRGWTAALALRLACVLLALVCVAPVARGVARAVRDRHAADLALAEPVTARRERF